MRTRATDLAFATAACLLLLVVATVVMTTQTPKVLSMFNCPVPQTYWANPDSEIFKDHPECRYPQTLMAVAMMRARLDTAAVRLDRSTDRSPYR